MARDSSYKKPGDSIVTVPMDASLHRKLRVLAAYRGETIKDTMIAALTALLEATEIKL